MLKNKLFIILLLVFILVITGCKNVNKETNINDKTVVIKGFDPDSYPNVIDVFLELSFEKIYNNVDELYGYAENIVYGTVKEISYFDESGAALTNYYFVVEKSYKGELKENDMISVLANGGYTRLQKYIEVFGDGKFKDYTKNQINQTVLKENPMGAPIPQAGDKYLIFISNPIKNEPPFPDGVYVEAGAFMGRYYDDGDKLTRYKPTENFYENNHDQYTLQELENILETLKNNE